MRRLAIAAPLEGEHTGPQACADAHVAGKSQPGLRADADRAEEGDDEGDDERSDLHGHAGLVRAGPLGVLELQANRGNGRDGVAQRAGKGHEVEERADGLHGEEADGDGQDKKVGQDGLAVAVALGEDGRQEVLATHGEEHAGRGVPEAQHRGADGQQHAHDADEDAEGRDPAGAVEDAKERVEGDEGRAVKGVRAPIHATCQGEVEDGVHRAAGHDRAEDGLLLVLDGEASLLDHGGHALKTEVRRDEERAADAQAVIGGVGVGEEVREVGDGPAAGEEHHDRGDEDAADGAEEHDGLQATCHDVLAQRHRAPQAQHHRADHQGEAVMNGPVEELPVQPVDDAQDAGGGYGEPGAHDEPGAPEAGVLVDAHGVKHQARPGAGQHRRELGVHKADRQNHERHEDEAQKRCRAAVRHKDAVPVTHEREDGAGGKGVHVQKLERLLEAAFLWRGGRRRC